MQELLLSKYFIVRHQNNVFSLSHIVRLCFFLSLVRAFLCFHVFVLHLQGILLKGGHVLDALAACQTIAFDKTGTLTTGKLMCKAIEPIHGHMEQGMKSCCIPNCEKEALAVAAAMERGTTHPIGR